MRTEDLLFSENRWSNAACKGYAIKACQALSYTEEQIAELLKMLDCMFSNHTIEEAEELYREY